MRRFVDLFHLVCVVWTYEFQGLMYKTCECNRGLRAWSIYLINNAVLFLWYFSLFSIEQQNCGVIFVQWFIIVVSLRLFSTKLQIVVAIYLTLELNWYIEIVENIDVSVCNLL